MCTKWFALLSFALILIACDRSSDEQTRASLALEMANSNDMTNVSLQSNQYRVLYLDSYHEGYSAGRLQRNAFVENLSKSSSKPQIAFHYMNCQNVRDENFIAQAALVAKKKIDEYLPDVIVVSDDTAMRTVIVPYYHKGPIPVVFIGINWDAEPYKLDYAWVCGQLELDLIEGLLEQLLEIKAKNGPRVKEDKIKLAILTGDTETDWKTIGYYKKYLADTNLKSIFVNNFDSWKSSFLNLQNTEDIIILRSNNGISGWDMAEAIRFVKQHGKLPSGSVTDWMSDISLLTYGKDNAEFGRWAAGAVRRLLNGEKPPSIGIVQNYNAKVKVNMRLAKHYGMTVSPQVLDLAELVGLD